MIRLPQTTNYYLGKDQEKASKANKMIGFGAVNSSTYAYAQFNPETANTGIYGPDDIVFVSVNGNRKGRISAFDEPFITELKKAIEARVTFITDVKADRERSYNIGEREVADILTAAEYDELIPGIWFPEDNLE